MVIVGVTLTVPPAREPGFQVKDAAPVEVNVTVVPAPVQMAVGLAAAVNVGLGLTVIAIVAVPLQPPLDPVTV